MVLGNPKGISHAETVSACVLRHAVRADYLHRPRDAALELKALSRVARWLSEDEAQAGRTPRSRNEHVESQQIRLADGRTVDLTDYGTPAAAAVLWSHGGAGQPTRAERYSPFFLGAHPGVLPRLRDPAAFAGVVVSDRYANYFHRGREHIAGNQACLAHLIRDYQDAVECYPARSGRCRPSGRCAG
jgi:hypothetical protein